MLVGTQKSSMYSNNNVFSFVQIPSNDSFSYYSINISNNSVQGSEGGGFLLPAIECSLPSSNYYANNTAGSCKVAFLYESFLNNP